MENSYKEAVRFRAPLIGTEHLLIALMRENDCVATRLLNTMGISIQKLYVDLMAAMGEDGKVGKDGISPAKAASKAKSGTPTLNSYGRDLTALAREGKLDPVIGREAEIQRVIRILSRRSKNNPCLIGEPGVGKNSSSRRTGTVDRFGGSSRNHSWKKSGDPGSVRHDCGIEISRRI